MRSSLTPLWVQTPRPLAQQAQQQSASVFRFKEPDPAPAAPVQPRVMRDLTVEDAHALSIETVNLIFKEDPKLAGKMIADAGKRRRGELETPMSAIPAKAHAIVLSGMRRRAEKLSDADETFLQGYLEEIGAA
jgi:hypothetical protein